MATENELVLVDRKHIETEWAMRKLTKKELKRVFDAIYNNPIIWHELSETLYKETTALDKDREKKGKR